MIRNFQALRALAALLVLFVHTEPLLRPLGITDNDLVFGYAGVDLFFVLSGFVIVHSSLRRSQSAGAFMLGRIARVVPLYWALTLGVFAIALIAPALLNSTDADWGNLAKSLLFIPYQKANGLVQPLLFVGWTLNYEMFFYLLFAGALALGRDNAMRTAFISAAALILWVGLITLTAPRALPLRFYGDTIVLEFVLGMAVGVLAHRSRLPMMPRTAVLIFLLSLAWLIVHPAFTGGQLRWVYAGIPSALMLASAFALEAHGHAARQRTVQLLGAASYALYLSHPFVLQAWGKLVAPINGPATAVALTLGGILFAHLVGVSLHIWFERPLTARCKQLATDLLLSRNRPGAVTGRA